MNWIEIKALNTLYNMGLVKINETLITSSEFKYLLGLGLLSRDAKLITRKDAYQSVYEREYLDKFKVYEQFLLTYELLKPQTKYEETDIKILIEIHSLKQEGNLDDLIQQLITCDETTRGVSEMFFKNEKYLDNKSSLIAALKKILGVTHFADEKDQQYIYKLECKKPQLIILCENLDFLKKPLKPRELGIELWYAGGKNVDKLNYSPTKNLPVFYSCDWDYDGLFVIYPLVKKIIPNIQLLTPNALGKGILESEHKSLWKCSDEKLELFSKSHQNIIKTLIENNHWITEEANNLIDYKEIKHLTSY